MSKQLNVRIANEVCDFVRRSHAIANPATALSSKWDTTQSVEVEKAHQKIISAILESEDADISAKMAKQKEYKSSTAFWLDLGRLVSLKYPKHKIRCNQFAATIVYFINLNRNFDTHLEIVMIGDQFKGQHYFVVAGRDPAQADEDVIKKENWGPEAFYMDVWGARQAHFLVPGSAERPNVETDLAKPFIINPVSFGNRMRVAMKFPAPSSRPLTMS